MRCPPLLALLLLASLSACAGEAPAPAAPADGPLVQHVQQAAQAHGVPAALVLAIGAVEGGLTLPRFREIDDDDEVPVAGIVELRRGAFDSLAAAADLAGRSEGDLRADTDAGTEAAVALMRKLAGAGPGPDDVLAWSEVVAEMSGYAEPRRRLDYAARVYRVLRAGGVFRGRDGEQVRIAAHPEIPVGLTLSPPALAPQGVPESSLVTEWVETPKSGPNGPCTNKWEDDFGQKTHIAIHDTEGGWDASLATLQNDGCKSVQYMIDKDGSRVAQFLPEKITAFHVGNYHYNQRSIGIEHVGKASETYAKPLYDKSVALVKDITARWKIPIDRQHIWGHYQVPDGGQISQSAPVCSLGLDACEKSPNYGGAGNHRDPGYNWQWCQYMERLGGSCECNDAWSNWNCTTDLTQAWRCNDGKLEKQECMAGCVIMPVGTPDECKTSNQGPSCGDLAKQNGWSAPTCEVNGNKACNGQGDKTFDCDHCCDAPPSGQGGSSGQGGGAGSGGGAQAGSGGSGAGSAQAGSGGSEGGSAGSQGGSAQAGGGGSAQAGSGGSAQAGSGGSAQAGSGGSGQAGSGQAGAGKGGSGAAEPKGAPTTIDLGTASDDGGCAASPAPTTRWGALGLALGLGAGARWRRKRTR